MRNEQRKVINFKLILPIIFILICSSIAIADQKVVNSENDFVGGSFSGLQLNIEPTNVSCNYEYTSTGYGFYTSGQHGCDNGAECNASGKCLAEWISGSCSGIEVYYTDSGYEKWATNERNNYDCRSPYCSSYYSTHAQSSKYKFVADNSKDFSYYPARDTCKLLSGRLPTIEELQCINDYKNEYGIFTTSIYWSSTEKTYSHAYNLRMSDGFEGYSPKGNGGRVQCIR